MKPVILLLALAMFDFLPSLTWAQSEAVSKTPEVFLPVRENGAKLRQGVYTAKGVSSRRKPASSGFGSNSRVNTEAFREAQKNGRVQEYIDERRKEQAAAKETAYMTEVDEDSLEGAFDYDQELFSFHTTRDSEDANDFRSRFSRGLSLYKEFQVVSRSGLVVTGAHYSTTNDRYVTFKNPPIEMPMSRFSDHLVFDGRTMGWGGRNVLQTSFTDENLTYFDNLLNATDTFQTELKSVDDESGLKKVEVIWSWPNEQGLTRVFTYWLDSKQGNQITKFLDQKRISAPKTPRDEEINNEPANSEATYTWEQNNDVWVLKTMNLIERPTELMTRQWTLDFTWTSVNKPVDDSHFDYKTWKLYENSRILDDRSGGGFQIELRH